MLSQYPNQQLICTHCKQLKDVSEFYKRNNTKRGYSYYCKVDDDLKRKIRYDNNKQAELDRCKQYVFEHKKETKEYQKHWYEENKDSQKEYKRFYWLVNRGGTCWLCAGNGDKKTNRLLKNTMTIKWLLM